MSILNGINMYEKVRTFRYVGSFFTNENSIYEEIKCRFKVGNSCYYSDPTLLSSRVLCKYLKIKINKTLLFPVVLYVCEIRVW